jgi:MFS family permease
MRLSSTLRVRYCQPMTTTTGALASNEGRKTSGAGDVLVLGAPVAAVLAGMASEWLDFRALRWPLLAMVLAGVLMTSWALSGQRGGWRAFVGAVIVGIATWGMAETLYVIIHVLSGERFDAERFGTQPTQALGLIAVHAVALGGPTGAVAGVLMQAWRWVRR